MQEQQASSVDWQRVEGEILCPLCEYNLRGLVEARCPECGYRFEWPDLIDPERRQHPYLFEHHPRRKVWSFVKTAVGGLRPRRFWRSLKPAQPSHRGRLMLYWVLASMMAQLLLPMAIVGFHGVELARWTMRSRARETAAYNSPSSRGVALRQFYPNQQAWIRALDGPYPRPPSAAFFQKLIKSTVRGIGVSAVGCAAMVVVWPWLTLLVLMIFVVSMRRASVRRIHVLRCVVYCGDAGIWAMIGAAAMRVLSSVAMMWISVGMRFDVWMSLVLAVAVVAFLIIFTYRLAMAYRYYLKFDHPVATVLSSQIISVLLVATGLVLLELVVG